MLWWWCGTWMQLAGEQRLDDWASPKYRRTLLTTAPPLVPRPRAKFSSHSELFVSSNGVSHMATYLHQDSYDAWDGHLFWPKCLYVERCDGQ